MILTRQTLGFVFGFVLTLSVQAPQALGFGGGYQSADEGEKEAYSLWTKPEGARFLQCNSYDFPPQDPEFNPSSHRWPGVSGIRPNRMGPYACPSKLPAGGLRVGGGKYSWASADGPGASHLGVQERRDARETRRNIASAQRLAWLHLEAHNPNWTYSLNANGIQFTRIPITVKCLYDRVKFVTGDGKYYYHNYYRYLGIPPHQSDYIPGVQVWDYKSPEDLIEELRQIPGCLEE